MLGREAPDERSAAGRAEIDAEQTTIANNQTKQVSFLSAERVRANRGYEQTFYDFFSQDEPVSAEVRVWNGSDFGRPIIAPPGVPPDKIKILRDAFTKTMADPELLAEAKRKNLDIAPTPGEELEALAKEVVVQPPEIVERLRNLMSQ